VDLRSLRADEGIVVVPSEADARELVRASPFRVVVLGDPEHAQEAAADAVAALPGSG
jgi:hypothetical protein